MQWFRYITADEGLSRLLYKVEYMVNMHKILLNFNMVKGYTYMAYSDKYIERYNVRYNRRHN